ncbi:MAG TPA: hypothetical protein H9811_02365 [Candidatus Gemmiger excrementigallinarum]|uniref:Uncharacterized protein n=1 Tax=Candidatus Gemmiger excrementigallinarum TaxID=2838609 RepID=A0A9D2EPX7_9FIRM|nr:hypothetical protein [Candidatus Gemmiger excrementigallinarum]
MMSDVKAAGASVRITCLLFQEQKCILGLFVEMWFELVWLLITDIKMGLVNGREEH